MARSRNIKPSFFKNEFLAKMKPHYRLLFIGLWTIADREGRLEDRPERIKVEVLPYEPVDIDAGLGALSEYGFITRYDAGGVKYIQVNNFGKHQNPHIKEQASTIPAPCEHRASMEVATLIPSSLIPDSPMPAKPAFDADAAFATLWQEYPRRERKKDAMRHFRASVKSQGDLDRIKAALANYKAKLDREHTEPRFIQQGGTWFNDWESWAAIDPIRSKRSPSPLLMFGGPR